IELQKLRLNDHTKITLSIVGDIDKFTIEPMLLIPILENAFKFGVDTITNSFIKIDLRVSEAGIFHFDVVNSIVINNKKSDKNSGIGIKNIRRRLDLIYGKNYTFGVLEQNGVFRVVLSLKLQNITQ
ncbi:MAG: histidine kinase, partial [Rikenellaceae bacterium]|nr:histidine kinase [Rikenellaceae bacterium]